MIAEHVATTLLARCLPATNNVLSEDDCRLHIVVHTYCGVGARYMPIAQKNYNKRHALSK